LIAKIQQPSQTIANSSAALSMREIVIDAETTGLDPAEGLVEIGAPAVRALQGQEGSEGYLMIASNQIFLVMDAGSLVTAFTSKCELTAYLKRRRDAFTNALVYTFCP
jgi:hypothetical protein